MTNYYFPIIYIVPLISVDGLTGSAVITHDVTTGTGYCLVGFNWIIDFFELANQTQRYINFEYRKNKQSLFFIKINILFLFIYLFFLPFENNIIKSISYEIIQNNLRIKSEVS